MTNPRRREAAPATDGGPPSSRLAELTRELAAELARVDPGAAVWPGGAFVDHRRVLLGALAPEVQRALVVLAADELGLVTTVRNALALLGLDPRELARAEAHGIVRIDGPRVRFSDPAWRAAAYGTAAPAERRAAHCALAESSTAPEHAATRAAHLAAGADGPSDGVALALGGAAADLARDGHTVAALAAFDRAIDFATTAPTREQLLLGALHAALDGLELHDARDLAARIDPISIDAHVAVAEALELAGVPARPLPAALARTNGTWARRRRARIATEEAARSGQPVHAPESQGVAHRAHALLADAQVHRHAGRLAEAREALVHAERLLGPSCTELAAQVHVLHADLDLLAGRTAACTARLHEVGQPLTSWTRRMADWVGLRVARATDTGRDAPWTARVGADVASEPLASIRSLVARASRARDPEQLALAVRQAEARALPVEAVEAHLARLEALQSSGFGIDADELLALSDRCWQLGVHAWDARLAALEASAARRWGPDLARLSQAERRVADAVGTGMTNREAAAALFLSVKTVDFHLQQIYRKLSLRSRTELAVLILGDGATRARDREVAAR